MKIGELAKLTGCLPVTIRFYEKEKLLNAPDRSGNNYRIYSMDDAKRLGFISHCRKHGFSIPEIRTLLLLREQKNADCHKAHTLVEECLKKITDKIQSLQILREELLKLEVSDHCDGNCAILAHLDDPASCKHCDSAHKK